jgi:hypothetical protein
MLPIRARASVGAASLLAALTALGCSNTPTFAANPHDAGVQCSDAEPCASGHVCLQGICYAQCDMMHACAATETCTSGVCVARPPIDAGPRPVDMGVDMGPPDPCASVRCAAPLTCREGVCVACNVGTDCGGATAICDFGRGQCSAFMGGPPCAPCNGNGDCAAGSTCVTRMAPDAEERVCLPSCGSGCPTGFSCDSTSMHCLPTAFSCTLFNSVRNHAACGSDGDCAQIAATVDNGLISGACAPSSAGMTCHYPCGIPSDCPFGGACTGGFCQY